MSIESVLAELRREYAPELAKEVALLLEQLAKGDVASRRTAHRIAGTAGSYGFHDIAKLARAIENTLEAGNVVDPEQLRALESFRP